MKRILFGFILGVLAGIWGHAWYEKERGSSRSRHTVSIPQKLSEVRVEDIRQELERYGLVVREKAGKLGTTIAETAADAKITATIKSRLVTEPGVSSLSINVDTADGLVTVSGVAGSPEEVAKVMRIALETDGVRKVVSTIQLRRSSG